MLRLATKRELEKEYFKHYCDVCGVGTDVWTKDWQWYGSDKEYEENNNVIIKTCSLKCRIEISGKEDQLLLEKRKNNEISGKRGSII